MAFSARKRDLTNASYLDRLGISSAAQYAPIVKRQAPELGVSLPLDDRNLNQLLNNTILALARSGQLPGWDTIPSERQSVFINAWIEEMDRQGIRS
jgi:hypothetical protein